MLKRSTKGLLLVCGLSCVLVIVFILNTETQIIERVEEIDAISRQIMDRGDDIASLEALAQQDHYAGTALLWMTLGGTIIRSVSNDEARRERMRKMLIRSIGATEGRELYVVLSSMKAFVLGFNEAEIRPAIDNSDWTVEDFQAQELRYSEAFKAAFSSCLQDLSGRYTGSLSDLYNYLELAYPILRPSCPELKKLT